jgi:alpha-1,3-rhamnosyl/mannosyltransferase
MTMRVVLDARTATDHFPGIGRYVFNLARALVQVLSESQRLFLLRDPTQPSRWDFATLAETQVQVVDVPISPFALRQQWAIPRLLRHLGTNLYHSPYYLMPYWSGLPVLVTIHDLIPGLYPHYFAPAQRLIFAATIRLALRASRQLIVVSQATAGDLQRLLGVPTTRFSVIPEAADPAFRPAPSTTVAALRVRLALPEGYVLYLGSNKPHKNLVRLVDAWARLQPQSIPLVIAGVWDSRYPEAQRRAEELNLGKAVLFLGPVAEGDLPALYSGAVLFVFPTEYEGFGLPVLEAMGCGTPVACSNTSSLPEVAGDAALMFDPTSVEAIAAVLHRLLADADLRTDLRKRGLRRSEQLSWGGAAQQTLAIYRHIA